jgi:hypothetical protein
MVFVIGGRLGHRAAGLSLSLWHNRAREGWKAVEVAISGRIPVNPSGGLIGGCHDDHGGFRCGCMKGHC